MQNNHRVLIIELVSNKHNHSNFDIYFHNQIVQKCSIGWMMKTCRICVDPFYERSGRRDSILICIGNKGTYIILFWSVMRDVKMLNDEQKKSNDYQTPLTQWNYHSILSLPDFKIWTNRGKNWNRFCRRFGTSERNV